MGLAYGVATRADVEASAAEIVAIKERMKELGL